MKRATVYEFVLQELDEHGDIINRDEYETLGGALDTLDAYRSQDPAKSYQIMLERLKYDANDEVIDRAFVILVEALTGYELRFTYDYQFDDQTQIPQRLREAISKLVLYPHKVKTMTTQGEREFTFSAPLSGDRSYDMAREILDREIGSGNWLLGRVLYSNFGGIWFEAGRIE